MLNADETERLRDTAVALAELCDQVVFVGGAVTSILIDDPGAPPVRVTDDVDVIVRSTRVDYYAIERRLRQLGFRQDPGGGSPICRWVRGELVLDVMPDDSSILGFSNRWYAEAFETAERVNIGEVSIRVVACVWFLATKVEAFLGRGNGDYLASHDLEDIIAVVDGRTSVVSEVTAAPAAVRQYLAAQVLTWLAEPQFLVALSGHVAGDRDRAANVFERLAQISRLTVW